jgi:hypothetical protein
MNTRKHNLLRAISSNIHFLGQCTLISREQVMSDQQGTGTPCNLIPVLHVCDYQTVTSCVQVDTLNSWQLMHHSEMKRGLFCLVSSRLKLHKDLWTIQIMGHGSLGKQCVSNSPILRSSGQPCSLAVPVSIFSRLHLSEKASIQSRGTFLQLFPLTSLAAITTGQAGAAYGHSQFLVMWAHCDIATKSFLIGQTA